MGVVSAAKKDVKDVVRRPVWYLVFGVLFGAFLWPMVKKGLVTLKSKGVPVPGAFTE